MDWLQFIGTVVGGALTGGLAGWALLKRASAQNRADLLTAASSVETAKATVHSTLSEAEARFRQGLESFADGLKTRISMLEQRLADEVAARETLFITNVHLKAADEVRERQMAKMSDDMQGLVNERRVLKEEITALKKQNTEQAGRIADLERIVGSQGAVAGAAGA